MLFVVKLDIVQKVNSSPIEVTYTVYSLNGKKHMEPELSVDLNHLCSKSLKHLSAA